MWVWFSFIFPVLGGRCWASWNCKFMSFTKSGEVWAVRFSHIFSVLPLLGPQWYTRYTFGVPQPCLAFLPSEWVGPVVPCSSQLQLPVQSTQCLFYLRNCFSFLGFPSGCFVSLSFLCWDFLSFYSLGAYFLFGHESMVTVAVLKCQQMNAFIITRITSGPVFIGRLFFSLGIG